MFTDGSWKKGNVAELKKRRKTRIDLTEVKKLLALSNASVPVSNHHFNS